MGSVWVCNLSCGELQRDLGALSEFVLVSLETWDSFGVYTGHGDTQEVPAIVNSKRQLMEDNRYSEHIDFYNI